MPRGNEKTAYSGGDSNRTEGEEPPHTFTTVNVCRNSSRLPVIILTASVVSIEAIMETAVGRTPAVSQVSTRPGPGALPLLFVFYYASSSIMPPPITVSSL